MTAQDVGRRSQHDGPQPSDQFADGRAAEALETAMNLQHRVLNQIGLAEPGLQCGIAQRPHEQADLGAQGLQQSAKGLLVSLPRLLEPTLPLGVLHPLSTCCRK